MGTSTVAGAVLLQATVQAGAAAAPVTRQSAWTVPVGSIWSLHLWDGEGEPAEPGISAGAALSTATAKPALSFWWANRHAGFMLFDKGTPVAAHAWVSAGAGADPDEAPRHAGALAAAFPLSCEDTVGLELLLRAEGRDPQAALAEFLSAMHLPNHLVGYGRPELAAWAARTPGAVHTGRMGYLATMRHLLRESPATNRWHLVDRERPRSWRLFQGAVALAMAIGTVILGVAWALGDESIWWVIIGAATTGWNAWGARGPRRSRLRPNPTRQPEDLGGERRP